MQGSETPYYDCGCQAREGNPDKLSCSCRTACRCQRLLGQRRWSERRDVEEDTVPDAASDVDAQSLYEAFEKIRPIPFTKTAVAPLVLAGALPMLAVVGIQLPVADLLKALLGALI